MTDEELRNSAALLRRGSWVAPELFEQAADTIERLQARIAELEQQVVSDETRRERIAGKPEAFAEALFDLAQEFGMSYVSSESPAAFIQQQVAALEASRISVAHALGDAWTVGTPIAPAVAALRADAERYRVIRDYRGWPLRESPGGAALDSYIDTLRSEHGDAARAAKQ